MIPHSPLHEDIPPPGAAGGGIINAPRSLEDVRALALLEHTGNILWTMPADGVIRTPNASWLAYTGQRPEAAVGNGWLEAVIPEDRQPLMQAITHGVAAGTPYAATCRIRRFDGVYRTFRVQGGPVRAADGTISEWVGCCTDCTEQQQAEDALARERQAFQRLAEHSPDIIARFDRQLRHLYLNPAITTVTGRAPAGFLGKTNEELGMPGELVPHWNAALQHVLTTGELTNLEFPFPTPSGERCYQSRIVAERNEVGEIASLLSITRDVTALKEAQAALAQAAQEAEARASEVEALLEAMTDGVFVYDRDGHIVRSNQAMRTKLATQADPGYLSLSLEERLRRLAIRSAQGELLPLEHTPVMRLLRGETLHTGEAEDLQLRTLEGRDLIFNIAGSALRDPAGAITGAVMVFRDVTEQRRLEAEREALRRLFTATFEQAAVGIAHVGLDGQWLRCNTRLCEITGYRCEDLAALTFQAITHPDDLVANLAYVRQLLAGEIPTYTMEKRYLRPDGSPVWVQLTVSLLRRPTGEPECFISVIQDISARKAAEEALMVSQAQLQQSAARLQAVLEVLPVGVAIVDAQGGFQQLNQTFKQIWGEEAPLVERVAEYRAYRGWWPDGRLLEPEEWGAALAAERGETVLGQEIAIETFTGERKSIDNSAVPIRASDGALVGAAVAVLDITERKRLEQQLRATNVQLAQAVQEAQARTSELEAILEAMTDGVLVYDREGHIVRSNQAMHTSIATQADPSYLSLPVEARLRRLEIRNAQGELLPLDQTPQMRLRRGETIRTGEAEDIQLRTLDGRQVTFNVAGAALRDATGAISRAVMIFRDVTERRRLERQTGEALQALLQMAEVLVQQETPPDQRAAERPPEAAQVAHQLADLTRAVLGCQRVSVMALTPETRQLRPLALVSVPPAIEADWFQTRPQYTLSAYFTAPQLQRLEAGEVIVADRTRQKHLDLPYYGGQQALVAPLRLGQQLLGLLALDYGGIPHSYTPSEHALAGAVAKLAALVLERDRLFGEREEARATALAQQETARQMSTLLNLIGHELRNPLTSLKGQVQLAQRQMARLLAAEDALPGTTAELRASKLGPLEDKLQRLLLPIGRLERLISDLLEAAHLQRGQLALEVRPCNLVEVVREVVEEQCITWPERAVALELPEAEEVVVEADVERVGQVVTNYLTNAFKYTPPDSPVAVTLCVEAGQAWVGVRDRGPGIPLEEQAHLWEQFRRGKGADAQSGKAGGLGLGLYLCKELIERQGGQVGLESEMGAGSTFWLRLPLAVAPR